MKLPSLLRLPKNKRFNYVPRYYDPVKDEIEEKESKFRRELSEEGRRITKRPSISEVYRRRSRVERKGDLRQIIFILTFTVIIFGYLYIGNYVFYFLLILIPAYIWARFRKPS
jgi:hypothetical protein